MTNNNKQGSTRVHTMKRTAKTAIILIFSILLAVFIISCSNDVQKTEPEKEPELPAIEVSLDLVNPKDLVSDHDRQVAYFSIDSKIISATQRDTQVVGEFEDLRVEKGSGTAPTGINLGLHTQGKWRFTASACNKDGDIIYRGTVETYISEATTPNKITIDLAAYNVGTGTLSCTFLSINIGDPRLVIEYQNLNSNAWTVLLDSTGSLSRNYQAEDLQNGYLRYTASNITMPTGAYKITVRLYNSGVIFSGETLDTYIFQDKNTELSGEFTIAGLATFVPVDPGQTVKFTDAAAQLGIMEGHIFTGFYLLGTPGALDFPYTNNTDQIQYLIPIDDVQDNYFTGTTTLSAKSTVSSLKYAAFSSEFNSSVTAFAANTFKNCTNLEAVYAPRVVSIGEYAFYNSGIEDWFFGTLQTIGAHAFQNSGIVETPKFSLTIQIGDEAFRGSNVGIAIIPSIATTGVSTFKDCTNLKRVECDAIKIDTSVFEGCTSLRTVILTAATSIQASAFKNCTSLSKIDLPETVQTIGNEAFSGCSSLDNTFHIPGSIGTNGGTRQTAISNRNAIGTNAFAGTTSLDEIYIDRMNGDLNGQPWGATCPVTHWGYKVTFMPNEPEPGGVVTFPKIIQKNNVAISPIDDPQYRIVSYGSQMGATLDGYPLSIPTTSGYGFIGWYTDPDITKGTKVTEHSIYSLRQDSVLYAQWQKGLVTLIFSPGQDYPYGNVGSATETYRHVRYMLKYGTYADEEPENDIEMNLPSAQIPGRSFLGWYLEKEPVYTSGVNAEHANEPAQRAMTRILNSTLVTLKDGHILYAHYKDHRYTAVLQPNLPTFNASTLTKNGSVITSYPAGEIPSRIVRYGFTFKSIWNGDTRTDTALPTPTLDNYYFKGWYSNNTTYNVSYGDNVNVPAVSSSSVSDGQLSINLYARWIGKELKLVFKSVETTPADIRGGSGQTVYSNASTVTNTFSTAEYQDYYVRYTQPYGKKINNSSKDSDYGDFTQNLPTPTRSGYTFAGWYIYSSTPTAQNQDGGTRINNDTAVAAAPYQNSGSINVYAHWSPNTYTVTFNANGGSVGTPTKQVTFHDNYGELPIPERTGYKFAGWFLTTTRGEGFGYDGARITSAAKVHTVGNHTLYAAWVSYELYADQSTTNTNFNSTNWTGTSGDTGNHATISYDASGLVTTYTITPQASSGNYRNSANNANNPTLTVAYSAIQVPTTNGKRGSNGLWTDNGTSPVSDFTVVCDPISSSGTNIDNNTSTMTKTTNSVKITPVAPGERIYGVYDYRYYGNNKTNDGNTNYARRSQIIYRALGDIAGFSIVGDDSIGVCQTKTYDISYTNKNTHQSQRGVTWDFDKKADANDEIDKSGHFTAGYENGVATLKATLSKSPLPPGTVSIATKNVTVTAALLPGAVKVLDTNTIKFTDAVKNSLAGNNTAPANAIPTTQCITGFYPYGNGNTSADAVAFSYTNSTGHSVWLMPVYTNAQNTSASNFLAPANQKYLAYPANVTGINGTRQGTSLEALYIPNSCTTINGGDPGPFEGCSKLVDVYLGSGVVTVGSRAFCNTKATIGEVSIGRLTTIGDYAFYGDPNLTGSITVKANVGSYAFYATGISGLVVNGSISIGSYAFRSCTSLTSVGLGSTTSLGTGCFRDCTALAGSVAVPNSVTSWGSDVFRNCSKLGTCKVDSSVVGTNAFYECSKLTAATMGSLCKTINNYGFYGCTALVSLNFGGVTTIGSYAFADCTALPITSIPATVTNIQSYAFSGCTKLSSLSFPHYSGFTIGDRAFNACSSLQNLYFPNMNFKGMSMGSGVWSGCNIQRCQFNSASFGGNQSTSTTSTMYVKCPGSVSFSWTNYVRYCSDHAWTNCAYYSGSTGT